MTHHTPHAKVIGMKKPGHPEAAGLLRPDSKNQEGIFIWQLVGVLDT